MESRLLAGVVVAGLVMRALEYAHEPPPHRRRAALEAVARDVAVVTLAIATQAAGTDVVARAALFTTASSAALEVANEVMHGAKPPSQEQRDVWRTAQRADIAEKLARLARARRALRDQRGLL